MWTQLARQTKPECMPHLLAFQLRQVSHLEDGHAMTTLLQPKFEYTDRNTRLKFRGTIVFASCPGDEPLSRYNLSY